MELIDYELHPYEPGVRESDEQVLALFDAMPTDHKYSWMTLVLVIYGADRRRCSARPQPDTAEVLTIKRKGNCPHGGLRWLCPLPVCRC